MADQDDIGSGGDAPDPGPTPDETVTADDLEDIFGGGGDPDDEEDDEDDPDSDDDPDDEDPEEDEEEEDEEKKSKGKRGARGSSGRSQDFQDLVARYGGDPDRMARSVLDNMNEKADNAKETKALRRLVEDLTDTVKELKAGAKSSGDALPPEVAEVDAEIKGLREELQDHIKDQKEALAAIQTAKDGITELNGQIKATPAEKRGKLSTELRDAVREYNQLVRDYRKDKKDGVRIQRELARKETQLGKVQEQIEERKREAKQREKDAARGQEAEGQQFTALVLENARALGIPKDRTQGFFAAVAESVENFLRRSIAAGETEPADLAELVAERAMRQARLMGVTPPRKQTVGERKMESLRRLGRDRAAQQGRAPGRPDRESRSERPRKRGGDALSKLSPGEQAAYFKKRARQRVEAGERG